MWDALISECKSTDVIISSCPTNQSPTTLCVFAQERMRTPLLTSLPWGVTLRDRRSGRSSNLCWAGWVILFAVVSVPVSCPCRVDFNIQLSVTGPYGRPEVRTLQEPVSSHHGPDDDSSWVWCQNDEEGNGGTWESLASICPNETGNSGWPCVV